MTDAEIRRLIDKFRRWPQFEVDREVSAALESLLTERREMRQAEQIRWTNEGTRWHTLSVSLVGEMSETAEKNRDRCWQYADEFAPEPEPEPTPRESTTTLYVASEAGPVNSASRFAASTGIDRICECLDHIECLCYLETLGRACGTLTTEDSRGR